MKTAVVVVVVDDEVGSLLFRELN